MRNKYTFVGQNLHTWKEKPNTSVFQTNEAEKL